MIICDVEQGSSEWFTARLGIPTASRFKDVVTSKLKRASGAKAYMHDLIAERVERSISMGHTSDAMARGTRLEGEARRWYEWQRGEDVRQVGFVYKDEARRSGASPDGLVGKKGGIEIKSPERRALVKHLLWIAKHNTVPTDYIMQCHGVIWTCDLAWIDFVLYSDFMRLPSAIVRLERDEEVVAALKKHINEFAVEVEHGANQIIAMESAA